jgi:hypothetical protein
LAVVAVLPMVTHTPLNPRITLRRTPPYVDFSVRMLDQRRTVDALGSDAPRATNALSCWVT